MKGRVIFGGSFDPVTKAHIDFIQKLSGVFDEVIVVPTYISPFKGNGAVLSGEQRLELVKKETEGIPRVTVSDIELKAGGTSYSYLTAKAFLRKDTPLYFAIGSDGLGSLHRWAHPEELARDVIFFVAERPFFAIEQAQLEKAREAFRVEVAPFVGAEGSSTILKIAVAFGKEDEIVPKHTAEYIRSNHLYRDYCYITERYNEFGLKPSRVEHIYRVAKASAILAAKNGVDAKKAVKAALMHDITKYLTAEQLKAYGVTEKAEHLPEPVRHQVTGALLARQAYGETDEEILAAIATHSTAAEQMTTLQKITFCADYIEDGRSFDGISEIRALTYANLDEGYGEILRSTIKYLTENNMLMAEITPRAYAAYKKQQEKL